VLSLKRRGEKRASDERILGSEGFIERLLSEAEECEWHRKGYQIWRWWFLSVRGGGMGIP